MKSVREFIDFSFVLLITLNFLETKNVQFKVQFKVQNYTVQSAVSNFDVSPCANTFLMLVLLFHESDYQARMANIVEKLKQFLDQSLINVRYSTNKCRNLS